MCAYELAHVLVHTLILKNNFEVSHSSVSYVNFQFYFTFFLLRLKMRHVSHRQILLCVLQVRERNYITRKLLT
jgi:hypothetical protein